MKKILLLIVVIPLISFTNAQTREDQKLLTTLYYERDEVFAPKAELDKLDEVIELLHQNPTFKVKIEGYGDPIGGDEVNDRMSLARAKSTAEYMMRHKVTESQIIFVGKGIDTSTESNAQARRVDVLQVTTIVVSQAQQPKLEAKKEEVVEVAEVVEPTKEVANEPAKLENQEVQPKEQVAQQPMEDITVSEKVEDTPVQTAPTKEPITLNYYIGAGVGSSFGGSTFRGIGIGTQLFGGVEFSELISTELSLGYSNITMNTTHCCESLYYVDGNRLFVPVAGKSSYKYSDITSKVTLLHLTAKVNFNLVSIWQKDSRWSALVSPKIGYIHSVTNLVDITEESSSHLSAGLDLSGGYMFNDTWGLRLTVGGDYLSGKGIDAMPQTEHKTNYVLSSLLSITYRF